MSLKNPMSAKAPNLSNGDYNNSTASPSGGPNVSIPSSVPKANNIGKQVTAKQFSPAMATAPTGKTVTCRYPKRK